MSYYNNPFENGEFLNSVKLAGLLKLGWNPQKARRIFTKFDGVANLTGKNKALYDKARSVLGYSLGKGQAVLENANQGLNAIKTDLNAAGAQAKQLRTPASKATVNNLQTELRNQKNYISNVSGNVRNLTKTLNIQPQTMPDVHQQAGINAVTNAGVATPNLKAKPGSAPATNNRPLGGLVQHETGYQPTAPVSQQDNAALRSQHPEWYGRTRETLVNRGETAKKFTQLNDVTKTYGTAQARSDAQNVDLATGLNKDTGLNSVDQKTYNYQTGQTTDPRGRTLGKSTTFQAAAPGDINAAAIPMSTPVTEAPRSSEQVGQMLTGYNDRVGNRTVNKVVSDDRLKKEVQNFREQTPGQNTGVAGESIDIANRLNEQTPPTPANNTPAPNNISSGTISDTEQAFIDKEMARLKEKPAASPEPKPENGGKSVAQIVEEARNNPELAAQNEQKLRDGDPAKLEKFINENPNIGTKENILGIENQQTSPQDVNSGTSQGAPKDTSVGAEDADKVMQEVNEAAKADETAANTADQVRENVPAQKEKNPMSFLDTAKEYMASGAQSIDKFITEHKFDPESGVGKALASISAFLKDPSVNTIPGGLWGLFGVPTGMVGTAAGAWWLARKIMGGGNGVAAMLNNLSSSQKGMLAAGGMAGLGLAGLGAYKALSRDDDRRRY